jgi:hypothetical protein
MEELPLKHTYIVQGHLHHRSSEGPSYERILLPSIVGGDILSNNKMLTTSRPAQQMFVFEKGEGLTTKKNIYFE